MTARRVLVAGCGDLGTRVAQRLVARGDSAFALSRGERPLPAGVDHVRGDLTDPASLRALPAPLDAVVYAPTPDTRTPEAYRAVFVDGLANLLDALPQAPVRLLYVSSTAVYGEDAGEWVDETTPPRPVGFNGAILLEGERLAAARAHGVALRLAGIYGPGRERLLRQARAGVAGTPRWTNRVHVDDAADALVHVLGLVDPAPCYAVVDDRPEREERVLAWLHARPGMPAAPIDVARTFDATRLEATIDGRTTGDGPGRRVSNRLLRASGWRPSHPDFRDGYHTLAG